MEVRPGVREKSSQGRSFRRGRYDNISVYSLGLGYVAIILSEFLYFYSTVVLSKVVVGRGENRSVVDLPVPITYGNGCIS